MEEPRLTTDIWVKAHLRQCMARNLPAYVLRKGAEAGATVLLKVNRLEQGCQLLSQARDLDGNLGWLAAFDGATRTSGSSRSNLAPANTRSRAR